LLSYPKTTLKRFNTRRDNADAFQLLRWQYF
jgi:hypothetical protein